MMLHAGIFMLKKQLLVAEQLNLNCFPILILSLPASISSQILDGILQMESASWEVLVVVFAEAWRAQFFALRFTFA